MNFATAPLSPMHITAYTTHYFDAYGIAAPHQKFISHVHSLAKSKLTESQEYSDIKPFIGAIGDFDTTNEISVGDSFAVLAFDIIFAWKEITALGFTTPKRVIDVKKHSDGTINYIKFSDGDRYPRIPLVTYNNKPLLHAAYFSDKLSAETALTQLLPKLPQDWDIDLSHLSHNTNESKGTK